MHPANAIIELAARAPITLVPIDGPEAQGIVDQFGFYSIDTIPADTYPGIAATNTPAVGAQWIASDRIDDELVYTITKALWNDQTRRLLDVGHAKGKAVTLETASGRLPWRGIGAPALGEVRG